MASSSALTVFFLLFSAATLLPILVASSGRGFSVELIHRDSPKSPFYDPNSTPFTRLRQAVERSRSRVTYFHNAIRNTTLSSSDTTIYSEIIPNFDEYLMSFYLGNPEKKIIALADTGSDLIWVQCVPCTDCYRQSAPLFNPQASSTYKTISCTTSSCSTLTRRSCSTSSQCQYQYAYGDGSIVEGFLSKETISFDSTGARHVQFPAVIFGCTHKSDGFFDAMDAGLVGLGGGKLSLVRQLGSSIGSRFSYCLPTPTQTAKATRLNFGSNAIVSGPNAVTTPLISGSPSTFYFLILEQIKVAGQSISVQKQKLTNKNDEGNMIIDSGTTLTYIDNVSLRSVENLLRKSVNLPEVTDPNGVFDLCFNDSRREALTKLPAITFQFYRGASVVLKAVNAFVEAADKILCLAMLSSGDKGDEMGIFGNIAQQNFLIGYDLDAMKLTFLPTDCATL